jgi:DNA-binding LytR/AlgR family response regulator
MNLLRQPYPQNETPGHGWRLALLFGVFVGAFLTIFQPFDLNTWQTDHKLLKIWGFGGITFVVMVVMMVVVPRLWPRFFVEEGWTVGKQIAYVFVQILLIAVANRLYLVWLVGGAYGAGWGYSLVVTGLVGIFPTTAAVVANYIRQLKRYQQQAATLSATLPPHPSADTSTSSVAVAADGPTEPHQAAIVLVAENEKDTFTLPAADLLAIESSDNYCTVFFARKQTLAKELMRSSLSRLETQLSDFQYIDNVKSFVRCHRSYVVNLEQVERISGNAQGYKLHLLGGQLIIPVARKYNDTLIAELEQQV